MGPAAIFTGLHPPDKLPTALKGGAMPGVNEIRPVWDGEFRPLPIGQTQFRPRWALFRVSLIFPPILLFRRLTRRSIHQCYRTKLE